MQIEEIVRKCQRHFKYREIVDEVQELIDYGSIVEFVVCEYAKELLKGIDVINLEEFLKGEGICKNMNE